MIKIITKQLAFDFANAGKTNVPVFSNIIIESIEINNNLIRIPIENFSILDRIVVKPMMKLGKNDLGEVVSEIAPDMYRVKFIANPEEIYTIVFV